MQQGNDETAASREGTQYYVTWRHDQAKLVPNLRD